MKRNEFEKKILQLRNHCQSNFLDYLKFVFNFPYADMHKDWVSALMNETKLAFAAPRAHAKSSLVSIAYSTWRIGRNPNLRVKVITNSLDKGREIVSAVSTTILYNKRFKLVFPNAVPSKLRFWTRDRLYIDRPLVLRDPTFEARSILSTGAGGRADLLIGDDTVDNLNSVTAGLRRKVKEAFYDVWMNTLEPQGSQVVLVGTIWDEDDLLSEVLRNKEWGYRKVWAINDNFDPLWPQVWTREKLYQRWKSNTLAFDKGFRQQPIRVENALFPPSCFKQRENWYLTPGSRPPEFALVDDALIKIYAGVDISAGHSNDYSVFYFVGVNVETRVRWPIDIIRVKQPSPDVTRLLIKKAELYRPEVIMVESNATQRMLQDWISEVVNLPLKPYYTGSQKHSLTIGVPSLRVELDNNMWAIPTWDHSIECNCAWCQWKREVLSFPYIKKDDVVMAWWFAREAIRLYLEHKSNRSGYIVVEI